MKFSPISLNSFFVLLLVALFSACSSSDDPEAPIGGNDDDIGATDDDPTPIEPENRTTGFVFIGTTTSGSALVEYVEELPTGTIDISGGTDFPRFFPTSVAENALFLPRPDESPGFSKYVVNADGELEEEGVIVTVDPTSFRMAVRDAEMGVFQDRATSDVITVFNPTTFEVTGTIDMTAGFVPDDIGQRYQRFMFRGDDVFAPVRGNINGESFPSFIVHQANLATNTFVGDTQRDGNGVSQIVSLNSFGQSLVDEAGNFYLADAGNINGEGIFARLNRVNAGSNEIDPTYVFEPVRVLNPANIFLPTFSDFTYISNGRAIARVNAETPQEAIDIVTAAGGVQNLSDEQIQQILGILFTAESAVWCELDVNALTVTPIQGIPALGIFAGGTVFSSDGEFYLPVATAAENGYYRYNPSTGAAEKAFEVTGAGLSGVFNIANTN